MFPEMAAPPPPAMVSQEATASFVSPWHEARLRSDLGECAVRIGFSSPSSCRHSTATRLVRHGLGAHSSQACVARRGHSGEGLPGKCSLSREKDAGRARSRPSDAMVPVSAALFVDKQLWRLGWYGKQLALGKQRDARCLNLPKSERWN